MRSGGDGMSGLKPPSATRERRSARASAWHGSATHGVPGAFVCVYGVISVAGRIEALSSYIGQQGVDDGEGSKMTFPRRKISTDDVIEGKVSSQSTGPRAAAPKIHFATCLVNG
ncbi:uncharacterized protein K489DRAFT_79076 [Dissoconium aciculare CBS 342.82]|uniref:Uncharacterized protein n=1 Tax=Dissoconium aciculare CBS 342.82 TaxID=1314786 RepID=A0A6J3LVK2_9PEZI|nr:uncharacterized protein K489DRAFT_79076 [Dissoconium aciculare CBS 342.82]KAF1819314.1 hypothetical protein K489DRAFT_79076 [Dissoconium aciculare CBS 342.82]